jgi:two-component system NtrC family sensor kinase
VEVSISDTGSGIPVEHLGKIFDPFFTTKAVGEGAGLGLSISFGIIKRHGGEIEVTTIPGEGATFTVRLPVSANSMSILQNSTHLQRELIRP